MQVVPPKLSDFYFSSRLAVNPKPSQVALSGLDEHAGLNAIERRKMLIEQYSVSAQEEDRAADLVRSPANAPPFKAVAICVCRPPTA
jgi:hypothetical protein